MTNFSIVIPAKNEEAGLAEFLPALKSMYSDAEIIVVNDGSTDATQKICEEAGVRVISHPYSRGNGAAIKTGARAAAVPRGRRTLWSSAGYRAVVHTPRCLAAVRRGQGQPCIS